MFLFVVIAFVFKKRGRDKEKIPTVSFHLVLNSKTTILVANIDISNSQTANFIARVDVRIFVLCTSNQMLVCLQICSQRSDNYLSTGQVRDPVRRPVGMDHARTYKDGGTCKGQEQDPTQETMVTGRHYDVI